MPTALRLQNQVTPLLCQSANVVEGAALVVGSADGTVALPAGADVTSGVLGLAMRAGGAGTTSALDVVLSGVFPGVASGAISRGDAVTVADATGKVKAMGLTTATGAMVVGHALDTVTDGQRVALLVRPEKAVNGVVAKFTAAAGATIAAGNVVVQGAADFTVKLPTAADPTGGVIGVALGAATAGQSVRVLLCGVTSVTANGAVARGDKLAVASSAGDVKTAAPAAGTNDAIVGYALQAIADGAAGLAVINPSTLQG